jgi:ABC-type multidrug transport system ATPase subunit
MKMVTGLIEPSGGVVLFDGKPILDDLMTFRQRVG